MRPPLGSLRLLPPLLAAASARLRPSRPPPGLTAAPLCRVPLVLALLSTSPTALPPPTPPAGEPRFSYYRLAAQLSAIEEEPSRLGKESLMREVLADAWRTGEEPLLACVALTTLQLEPSAKPAKLGMGTAALVEAIVHARLEPEGGTADTDAINGRGATLTKATIGRLKAELKELGDIGLLASRELAKSRDKLEPAKFCADGRGEPQETVDVLEVLALMRALVATEGEGSASRKPQMLGELLRRLHPGEAKMLMRAIAGKLRVGLGAASLRAALAQAALPHSDLDGKRARTTQADLILVGGSIGGEQGAALATAVDDLVRQSHSDLRFAAMAAKRDPNETDPNNAIDVDMGDIMRLISLGFVGGKEAEIAEAELRALFKGAAAGPRAEGLRRVREILGLARKQRTEAIGVVNSAFQVRPCYHSLVRSLYRRGVWQLGVSESHPGVPVQPMAAAPAVSIDEVMMRMSGGSSSQSSPFVAELKYDGERCQLHWIPESTTASLSSPSSYPPLVTTAATSTKTSVRIFARSLDDVSSRFPDAADALMIAMKFSGSAILDAEVCAYDPSSRRPLPFQTLAARPRKPPTREQMSEIPVCVYVFDLLSLDGRCLLQRPLAERRALLRSVLCTVEGRVEMAKGIEGTTASELQRAFDWATALDAEGLMVKSLDPLSSSYEPGKRSLSWIKLKRDYVDGLADSLDLAPIGAYAGEGRRAGGFGAFLLAARASDGRWQPVCKIGSGFTDEDLVTFSRLFVSGRDEVTLTKSASSVRSVNDVPSGAGAWEGDVSADDAPSWVDLPSPGLPQQYAPDIWLGEPPDVLWEVRAAALSLSPVFTAAAGMMEGVDPSKGLGLRFPRFVRERPDKPAHLATDAKQLVQLFMQQREYEAATTNGAVDEAMETQQPDAPIGGTSRREEL